MASSAATATRNVAPAPLSSLAPEIPCRCGFTCVGWEKSDRSDCPRCAPSRVPPSGTWWSDMMASKPDILETDPLPRSVSQTRSHFASRSVCKALSSSFLKNMVLCRTPMRSNIVVAMAAADIPSASM